MATLPTPGGDVGTWADELNTFLGVALNSDGTLKPVTNAEVSATAAIARSKLDFGGGLVNSDVSTSAAIARSKLSFGSGLVDSDIATGAAIAEAKLSLASDAAAGTASRRSLGTGATQAAAGNDARFKSRYAIRLTAIGLIGESFQRINSNNNNSAPTAGVIYLSGMPLLVGDVITTVYLNNVTAAAGTNPTNIFVALLDKTGKVLRKSADMITPTSGAWTAANSIVGCNLTSSYTISAGDGDTLFYLGFLQVGSWGTTQHAMLRQLTSATAGSAFGSGAREFATGGTSQTAFPAEGSSVTVSSASANTFWAGAA